MSELVLNAPTCMNCGGLTNNHGPTFNRCNCHEDAFADDEDDRPPRTSRDRAIANSVRQMTPQTLNDLLMGPPQRGRNDTNVTLPHQSFSTDEQHGEAPPTGKPSQAAEEDERGTEVVDLTQENMARLGLNTFIPPSYLGAAGAPPETPARVTTNQQGGVDLDPTQTWPPTINWAEVVREQQDEDRKRSQVVRNRRQSQADDDLPGTIITDGMWPPVIRW